MNRTDIKEERGTAEDKRDKGKMKRRAGEGKDK